MRCLKMLHKSIHYYLSLFHFVFFFFFIIWDRALAFCCYALLDELPRAFSLTTLIWPDLTLSTTGAWFTVTNHRFCVWFFFFFWIAELCITFKTVSPSELTRCPASWIHGKDVIGSPMAWHDSSLLQLLLCSLKSLLLALILGHDVKHVTTSY